MATDLGIPTEVQTLEQEGPEHGPGIAGHGTSPGGDGGERAGPQGPRITLSVPPRLGVRFEVRPCLDAAVAGTLESHARGSARRDPPGPHSPRRRSGRRGMRRSGCGPG
jgi:hypothetical protein